MLSPEILAEQVMGYVVWASELIPTLKPSPDTPYSVAILPQWPHFYTWLLQAAGYLLLDNQKKKLLIISQQSDDSKNILVDSNSYGPVFGQTWKNSITAISNLVRHIGAKLARPEQKSLLEQMRFQLPFLRIITESNELLHISVWEKTSQTSLDKLLIWIKNNIQDYNIILLTNIELSSSTKSKKSDEQKQIAKIIQTTSLTMPLLTIFHKTLDSQKKKPEIVAYVNPGDFGKTASLTTRYICAVG